MAQVTRENVRSQFRGEELLVLPYNEPGWVVGRFVRTNVVVSDNQQYLYVTLDVNGKHQVFDVDKCFILNHDTEGDA